MAEQLSLALLVLSITTQALGLRVDTPPEDNDDLIVHGEVKSVDECFSDEGIIDIVAGLVTAIVSVMSCALPAPRKQIFACFKIKKKSTWERMCDRWYRLRS